jgi:predicted tellurium resistance membrane protein TerC
MTMLADPQIWIAFLTLTLLELVLGIDNIVFISILADRLPEVQRAKARRIGLALAMVMRIGLLFVLSWLVGLTAPWFSVLDHEFSGRDLILLGGGLFLLWKSTKEIHHLLEGQKSKAASAMDVTFSGVILQIIVLDAVFSLDSIITAVGLVDEIQVMVAAIIVAVTLMMIFAGPVGNFVSAHPSVKMLALSFLAMIGLVLIADGFQYHIPKGFVYFAMAFSLVVEILNLRMRRGKENIVSLNEPYRE